MTTWTGLQKGVLFYAVMVLSTMTAFSCAAGSDSVDHYNIVWDSPGAGSSDSMPLGNGDIGLNVWTEENGDLLFYISKTDSWGDNSRLLKVGKVRIRVEPSPLATGDEFRQTLSLKEGAVRIQYGKPGRSVNLAVWVDANNPVIHVSSESPKPVTLTVTHEPWRTEPYELPSIEVSDINLDRSRPGGKHAPTIVEPDTILKDQHRRIGWFHHNTKSVGPDITMRIQGLSAYKMTDPILHRTFGAVVTADNAKRLDDLTLTTTAARSQRINVYVLTRHPSTPDQWTKQMDRLIDSVEKSPFEKRLQAHNKWWSDFWDRSWIYATQNEPGKISVIKSNDHPVRIGVDQHGHNRFGGSFGRVSVFSRAFSPDEIDSLFKLDRTKLVSTQADLRYCSLTHGDAAEDSQDWTFAKGLTVEAWVRAEQLTAAGGRIIDNITPGGSDGFLLDTHPGNSLRFIAGADTIGKQNILPAGEWSHVAAVAGRGGIGLFLNGKQIAHQPLDIRPDAFVVTRGYVLQRFINACAGRGAYPIKFNGSIFTVDYNDDPDYRRWGPGYWWQNTRLPYISMCASGDFDLMQPLFEMYAGKVFELSKYRTQHYFGHAGAYYPECIYFWGTVFSESYGWTPAEKRQDKLQTSGWHKWEWVSGLEFVWMMLDYYEHTLDEKFLKDKLLPVADEVLVFFDNYYDTNADGKLVMHPSQAVETWWECTNPMPELAGLIAVTQKLLQLPNDLTTPARREYWRKLSKKLPELPTRKVGDIEMLAPAEKFDQKRNIENPELYAVFPFRLVALGKGDIELGIEALNHRWDRGNSGWRQDDIFMAWLGLAGQARENLVNRARRWHTGSRFPAFWGPNYDWVPDQDHGGILLKAFQAMLMQTDGRKIYLLGAWPKEWDVDFKLHAPYNTTVSGTVRNGTVKTLTVAPPQRRKDVVILQPQ